MNPLDLLKKVQTEQKFIDWKKEHLESFISHFFCQINSSLEEKSTWNLGYYDKNNDKITTFIQKVNSFEIKNEDEVFKKENDKVEKLNLEQIKITFSEAKEIVKKNLVKLFPNEQTGDGFVILQTINQETTWNFTFVTKTLKLINIKVNAFKGKISSHQTVELLQKS